MQVTYTPDEPRLFWLHEKPEDPQFEPHARDKNGAGFGISCVYLWLSVKDTRKFKNWMMLNFIPL